jgi:hypothetical protein
VSFEWVIEAPPKRGSNLQDGLKLLACQGYPAARVWTDPLNERFEKIGTYEVYQVKCNLVNGLPPIVVRAIRPEPKRSGQRKKEPPRKATQVVDVV